MFGSMRRSNEDPAYAPSDPSRTEITGPPIEPAPNSSSLPWDLRVQTFIGLFVLSIIASICGSYLLVLMKLTGFCVMTSISAVLSLTSTCFLMGPIGQIKKMFHKSRWLASVLYLLMIALTLIAGLALKNAPLAIVCTAGQYIAMAWYSLSYIPYAREAVAKICC